MANPTGINQYTKGVSRRHGIRNPQVARIPAGLKSWVKEFRTARNTGVVSTAKTLQKGINKQIKTLGLNKKLVYGASGR